jgi:tripartite-type tricarboxylate transporter receptor subunit TctC
MRCRNTFRAADHFTRSIEIQRFVAGLLVVACSLLPAVARADVADFYKGKTVEVLVGFSAGGGYDLYARALAKSIGKYIPGTPSVVVRNFTGAGSLRLARFLQDAAPHDGLTIGTMDNGLLTAGLMNPSAGFDASKLEWVGAIAKDVQVIFLWNKQPGKTTKSLGSEKLVFGATGTDDIRYTSTNVLKKLTSANINIVTGYPGTSDIRIAVERGELDGLSESWTSVKSTKPEWVERHQVTPIVQFAFAPHPELKDVPLISTYARSPEELEALKVIFSSGEAGRPFAAPPGVPPDRLEALRQAFTKTMSDPEFLAYANQAKLEVVPSTGEEVAAFVNRIAKSPPAVVETARKLLEP